MKRLIPLLILLMLLCGCSSERLSADTPEELTAITEASVETAAETVPEPTLPPGTYDPDSLLEAETYGAVKVYPLGMNHVRDIQFLRDSVLVFSGDDDETVITQLSGDTLYPEKSFTVDTYLYRGDFQFYENSISFFHPEKQRVLILSLPLQEIRSIPAPEGMIGTPMLSQDQSTMYYCTQDTVRALDLESGISRMLKEISCQSMSVAGMYFGGDMIEIQLTDKNGLWRYLYLSTEDGRILWEDSGELQLFTSDSQYFANYYEGTIPMHLFGTYEGNTQELSLLHPQGSCFYLPESHGAVTVAYTGEAQVLDYYDLNSGLRTGSLSFPVDNYIHSITEDGNGRILFLCYSPIYECDVLYAWDPAMTLTGDSAAYTAVHYTAEMPDYEALEACRDYALCLSEKHGVEILIYKDAAAIEPTDYDLEPEHNATVINRELDFLDRNLQNYPEGFLATLAEHFEGIRICIVKSLKGSAEAGSLETADGVQFWNGYTAYIALSAHQNTEYALYHELCHLIDSIVLTESNAYDRWDTLNPSDFEYDYSYVTNVHRNGSPYLQAGRENFIDTYSMSFPKEDRARIMEYAMADGNAHYFQSQAMQKKLLTLCQGVRDAFGLKKSSETFLWEQYLTQSLAYTE